MVNRRGTKQKQIFEEMIELPCPVAEHILVRDAGDAPEITLSKRL